MLTSSNSSRSSELGVDDAKATGKGGDSIFFICWAWGGRCGVFVECVWSGVVCVCMWRISSVL